MTQSKKNLEKHLSGSRNPGSGRLLIDQAAGGGQQMVGCYASQGRG